MPRVELKGIHRVRKRLADGRTVAYHYAWRGGPRFWASTDGVPEGGAEYLRRFRAAAESPHAAASRSTLTLSGVIDRYLDSAEHAQLSPRTRADYRLWLDRFRETFGTWETAAFNDRRIRGDVTEWRDRWASSPRQADYAATIATMLIGWAYDRALLEHHHLRALGSVYRADRAEAIWTPDQISAWRAAAAELGHAHMDAAMTLAVETGFRPGDLIRVGPQHRTIVDGRAFLALRTRKRKRVATMPVSDALQGLLDAVPRGRLVCLVDSAGRPWRSAAALSQAFHRVTEAAGITGLRLQDLRGTAATRRYVAGDRLLDIAAWFGWSPEHAASVIESYVAAVPEVAIQRRLAEERGRA